jgi:hypothetical protein
VSPPIIKEMSGTSFRKSEDIYTYIEIYNGIIHPLVLPFIYFISKLINRCVTGVVMVVRINVTDATTPKSQLISRIRNRSRLFLGKSRLLATHESAICPNRTSNLGLVQARAPEQPLIWRHTFQVLLFKVIPVEAAEKRMATEEEHKGFMRRLRRSLVTGEDIGKGLSQTIKEWYPESSKKRTGGSK